MRRPKSTLWCMENQKVNSTTTGEPAIEINLKYLTPNSVLEQIECKLLKLKAFMFNCFSYPMIKVTVVLE